MHQKGTGVSNELIISNFKKLSKITDMIIRVPVIGGFNDSFEEMQKIIDLLKENGIKKAEFLPYHKMGENKYYALNSKPEKFYIPDKDFMDTLNDIMAEKCSESF
mgnify:FL=1